MKEMEQGSVFSSCSHGIPYTDGLPCRHMVAVVKSSQIEGLNPTNTIPYWWTTECWRSQYPFVTNVTCDFDIEALRAAHEDTTMRYCPPYAAANKTGCPKIDKQIKSPHEGNNKRKHAGKRGGKGGGRKRRMTD
jgi:hypothetical protein